MSQAPDGDKGKYPDDLVEFTQAAIKHFGRGVRWTYLQVASVPGWQLGESPAQWAAQRRLQPIVFETGKTWGFGRPPELGPRPTSSEPQQERRSPKAKQLPRQLQHQQKVPR